jgi:hypothetical protein
MAVVEGTRQGGLLRVTLLLVVLGYSYALYGELAQNSLLSCEKFASVTLK